MANENEKFPVVGVGASAGGIPALEGLFGGIEADCGMAFVVITHLSPDRQSLLHEVIARYTDMPVVVAKDAMTVEPNHIYVLPENAVLRMKDGRLRLKQPDALVRERKPIDVFFASLAEDRAERAVGIILSGGDGDGTLGVKAIKEHSGLSIAQGSDDSSPKNPEMPRSAIASGLVDITVAVEKMGEELARFSEGLDILAQISAEPSAMEADRAEASTSEIYAILRTQAGHDFSGYKSRTFLRRVARRMQVTGNSSIEAYAAQLKRDPTEAMNLFRDLLIGVTGFFRGPEAFKALETNVIPRLFEQCEANDTIRIWIPGCATGEEVYSIGILLREQMDRQDAAPRAQIFATDIDEPALAVARAGRYPETMLEGLTPERRKRFFVDDGAAYTVSKDVREMCIFSPHSVMRDPPFLHMDLVSCRNLLIYFGPDIQNRVVPMFHHSLRHGGYLFLGTSEGAGQHSDLFSVVDKEQRIFQSRGHVPSRYRPAESGGAWGRGIPAHGTGSPTPPSSSPLKQTIDTQVLERFAPAHVVVNGDGEVVYYSTKTGRFLEAPQGSPNRQLLAMTRRGLRPDLRSALREAVETQRRVTREDVVVDEDEGQVQLITLTAEPLDDSSMGEPHYLVVFAPSGPSQPNAKYIRGPDTANATGELESELRETRDRLQATIEDYETALEELKSSNEELVSVNEEAQSSNEELEASKEEMQSLNEELHTVNAELYVKVEDLDRANADLKNVFEISKVATVFLDRDLVIRNFTPLAANFFKLRGSDTGRPLTDLSSNIEYSELEDQIAKVFDTGEMIEHYLSPADEKGEHYLVRLAPYRSEREETHGVVVTLVDVTRLTESEAHQKVLIAELNHRVKNMLAVIIGILNQTLKGSPSLQDFKETFEGRLHAMARSHTALSQEYWIDVPATEIVQQGLAPFGLDRVAISGPDIRLAPRESLSLGMALHELATNATKHGALSTNKGGVTVAWEATDGQFRLRWREENGPKTAPPDCDGFGLSLVKGEIEHRLHGEVTLRFGADGLEAALSFPKKS